MKYAPPMFLPLNSPFRQFPSRGWFHLIRSSPLTVSLLFTLFHTYNPLHTMSYPLPPLSTLSAALSAVSSSSTAPPVISPDLLGEAGQPPRRPPGRDFASQIYASSSADTSPEYRVDDASSHREWYRPGPWEQGYRAPANVYAPMEDEPPAEEPSKKRKARGTRVKQEPVVDDEEDGELEYEDPENDPKSGPVFVHPPKGAAQACVRCHKIKRKCDNARPRCGGCDKANVRCVFELSPATSQ